MLGPHGLGTLGPEDLPFPEGASARQPEAYRQRLWEELEHVLPSDSHIHVEYVLSEEDEVTAILRTQMEAGCDLIVMGTHGLTGWRRWPLGSVGEQVVRRAACPVLVIKEPKEPNELPEFNATDLHPRHLTRARV